MAFLGLPGRIPGLAYERLATSPFVAVLPAAHPRASQDAVALAELSAERWVDAREGFGNRVTLDRALDERGLSRRVSTEVSDLGEIPRFVAADLGVAVIPKLTVVPADGAVVVPLTESVEWELSAVTRPRPSAAAAALVELMREHLARPSA